MTCAQCGTDNEPGRKFCAECGSKLALPCPACGAANSPSAKFCGECGTGLQGEEPVQAPPAAERRLVSVLFADLVGFTAASEDRDAEETRELLSRYFDSCRTLIERYGGTVEKFIGDAVMAVWGTPVAQEDDAERAVRAALDLIAAVPALDAALEARAGVLTGEAAVTIGAEGEGMVAGDLVNTASRIQSAAEPGAVLVGEATKRATDASIAYASAGEHELKGKTEPVPLWQALRVTAGRAGALKSVGLEPPFVGRDRELRLIKELFHASAEEGKTNLVSVLGIAGIGKSRLVWEFYKYIDGLAELIRWHRGRCLAYGEGVTYWALAEMVRGRAEIVEAEEPDSAKTKLRAMLELHVPDAAERAWIEPRLAHLLGLEESSLHDRADLFAAWRLLFERLADEQPTVLVFEDMQWADTSMLEFVEYLLEWSRGHRIFVLALARPEVAHRHPTWGAGTRNTTSFALEPLPAAAMKDLLEGLVPGLPDALRAQILERAEGVPLYAVETVRMLLDRGLVELVGNQYRVSGQVETLEVPETLHALIAARLDGLAADERRLLQDASVLGKTFTKHGLADVSGIAPDELEPLLGSLVRKEVLSIQADPRSPERGQYGFLQDLLRRVAYETLARSDRKARHLAAAAHLEESWGHGEHEVAEVVSSHYVEAYEAAPQADDAAEIKAKARSMLSRAGDRAASLAANEEAQRYFEQAAALADGPLEAAQLYERAGRMAWLAGRAEDARAHFGEAIARFDAAGLAHPAARVSAALAEILWQEGKLEEAIEDMERAFGVLAEEAPDADLAALASQLGRLLYFAGRPDDAAARIEFALSLAEPLRLPEVFAQSLITKGIVLSSLSRRQEGSALIRHALEVALENGLSVTALRAYQNLGVFAYEQDRHAEALELLAAKLELARKTGNRMQELTTLAANVGELVWLGRWDEAVAAFDELGALEGTSTTSVVLELIIVAWVHAERGEIGEARRVLATLAGGEASGDVQARSVYWSTEARLRRAEGRLLEALGAGERAFALRRELGLGRVREGLVEALEAAFALGDEAKIEELLGVIEDVAPGDLSPWLTAQGARFAARLSVLRGATDNVAAGFTAAAETFRELSMPFWLAVAQLEHGEWLVALGRSDEAEPLLDEAHEIFVQLDAAPWLARCEKARTRQLEPA